jgi:hypothetical protein
MFCFGEEEQHHTPYSCVIIVLLSLLLFVCCVLQKQPPGKNHRLFERFLKSSLIYKNAKSQRFEPTLLKGKCCKVSDAPTHILVHRKTLWIQKWLNSVIVHYIIFDDTLCCVYSFTKTFVCFAAFKVCQIMFCFYTCIYTIMDARQTTFTLQYNIFVWNIKHANIFRLIRISRCSLLCFIFHPIWIL